ncbi:MAG: hypothetical protein IVW36_11235 [Dehalococcoidia bacterium]|nr:hypothetical protein [Dehalococcoidia bacterium]
MLRVDPAAGIAFAVDGATAVAGCFNAAWLAVHRLSAGRGERRAAALTLLLINAGAATQAVFAQTLYSVHRFGLPDAAVFSAPVWLASRALLLLGTLLLSLLILRSDAR